MEFRSLTIKNYDEITCLWKRAGLPYRPEGRDSKSALTNEMRANPDFFLGAFENNRLIGVVVLSSDMRKGWVNRLAVDPGYRRRGVAKALIAKSEETFRKHGLRIFGALIEDYNKASMRLFKECGYVEHRDVMYFSKRESKDV